MASGRRRLRSVLLVVALLAIAVASVGVGVVWNLDRTVNDHLTRVDGAFPAEEGRPPPASAFGGRRPVTMLVLGARELPQRTTARGVRAETMMLVRVAADRQRVDVVSIPADAMVEIPGFGTDRISSAATRGGLPLAVETMEDLLAVRIDHVAVVDLDAVAEVTDALDGVDLRVDQPFRAGQVDYEVGVHHIDGAAAAAIVREQRSLPGRDLDRARNQQAFLAALISKASGSGVLADPRQLRSVLAVAADNAAVDSGLDPTSLRGLAISLRTLRPSDVHFWTAPLAAVHAQGRGPLTVELSEEGLADLRAVLIEDTFEGYQG